MNENTKLILAGLGGGVLAIAGFLGIDPTSDTVPSPIVVTATPEPQQPAYTCPPGWEIPEGNRDEHGIVYVCQKNGWLVILDPVTHRFERATHPNVTHWVENPREVPEWPAP